MIRWKKPGKPSVKKGPPGFSARLHGGPLDGVSIKHRGGDGSTLTVALHGQVGRYIEYSWRPVNG
jgi:hypothetical protein